MYLIVIILFSLATRAGSPQQHEPIILWARITYPTLSTFPVGGNWSIRRKPTTFGRLYSFHMRTGFTSTTSTIEVGTLEGKGGVSDLHTLFNDCLKVLFHVISLFDIIILSAYERARLIKERSNMVVFHCYCTLF